LKGGRKKGRREEGWNGLLTKRREEPRKGKERKRERFPK